MRLNIMITLFLKTLTITITITVTIITLIKSLFLVVSASIRRLYDVADVV